MHYHGILLCNTCPGSIYEHEVYYEITDFVNQKLCCCVFFAKMVLPSSMLNILSVMFLCDCVCLSKHIAVGFTVPSFCKQGTRHDPKHSWTRFQITWSIFEICFLKSFKRDQCMVLQTSEYMQSLIQLKCI